MKDTTTSDILTLLNIQELPSEEQEELLLDLTSLIFKGSLVRIIELMDSDTRDSFNSLMDTDPVEDEVEQFLTDNVPGADQAVQDTLDELRNDILAVTGPITS
ncbi:hypothetical protein BH11PAT2_BH11PAT2_05100 [soil metagenome]